MTRKQSIIDALQALDASGEPQVKGWYAYAPGDVGIRWVLATKSYSTREVEALIEELS